MSYPVNDTWVVEQFQISHTVIHISFIINTCAQIIGFQVWIQHWASYSSSYFQLPKDMQNPIKNHISTIPLYNKSKVFTRLLYLWHKLCWFWAFVRIRKELPRRQVAVVTRVSMEVDWCGIRLSQLYWEVCLSQLTSSLASLGILLSYACNNKHSVFLIHSICIFYSLS